MSRQVDLSVGINETPVITSLDKMIKKFKELNDIKESIAPKGKIKIEIDSGNIKEQTKGLTDYNKELKKTATSMTRVAKASEGISKAGVTINNTFNTHVKKLGDTAEDTASKLVKLSLLTVLIEKACFSAGNAIRSMAKEMLALTDNTYGVGVASQMVTSQINALNDSFLKLSQGTPVSAKELAKATDDLVRTGRTYAEASKMMAEISKLSVASGEPLKETATVATKIMVSLGIEAERSKQALNALHSVAIQTASSMGGLSESFKQFAGTLGVFASTAEYTGDELDDYKQNILELGLSATGVLNNLGLSAGSAGTKVKILFSKLISLEKSAKSLFNEDMAKSNIYVDNLGNLANSLTGSLLNADRLSELAQKNLPKAIELLSKLQLEGKLGITTLQKMFT
ncbi:MAG: phage tail tape measure protein, partial [Cetobacterium somerae]